jgi:hypothetical protein
MVSLDLSPCAVIVPAACPVLSRKAAFGRSQKASSRAAEAIFMFFTIQASYTYIQEVI